MADASVDVAEAGPLLRLADAVEALSEGFAVFDETAAMVLCNSRFRLMNPAMADLLVPGVTWEILVREAAQRGLLDAAQVRQLRWIESRLEPGADESVEVEALNGSIGIVTLCASVIGFFGFVRPAHARAQAELHAVVSATESRAAASARALSAEVRKNQALEERIAQLSTSASPEPKTTRPKSVTLPPPVLPPHGGKRLPSCKNDGDPLEKCLP